MKYIVKNNNNNNNNNGNNKNNNINNDKNIDTWIDNGLSRMAFGVGLVNDTLFKNNIGNINNNDSKKKK